MERYKNPFALRRLALPLFALLLSMMQVDAHAAPHSIIFVVDSSGGMSEHLDSVKATILSYIEQSQRGDSLGVISFSNTAKLLSSKKITGPSDRKSLELMLNALTPHGEVADLDRGIERALEEVVNLKRRGDQNIKGIIVISASILAEDRLIENLDKTLQEVSKLVPADEWYIQYCYLDGARDKVIADFVESNDGFAYDVDELQKANSGEIIAELYKIAVLPEENCAVTVADLQGTILKKPAGPADEWSALKTGEAVEEGNGLNAAENSRLVLNVAHFGKLGLAPATEIIFQRTRRNAVTGRADIRVSLESGSAWIIINNKSAFLHLSSRGNSLELSGQAGSAVRASGSNEVEVVSFSGSLSVKPGDSQEPVVLKQNQSLFAKDGRLMTPPVAAEAKLMEEWKYWTQILSKNVRLVDVEFAIPEVTLEAEALTLGPLQPGKMLDQRLPLRLRNVPETAKLKVAVDVSVPLPEGISVTTALIDGQKANTKEVLLKLDGSEGFASGRTEEHKGFLRIAPAPDSGVNFEKVSVPLTIITQKSLISKYVIIFAIIAACLGAAGFASTRVYRKKEVIRPRPHRVIGRLIIIDDPTRGRTGSINLEEISTKSSRLSLAIGRDKTTEIRLKHASVQPSHCLVEANLVGDHLVSYIEPIASASVQINKEKIASKTRLEDGDKITIGEFSFQFEDTQFYKKIAVVYSNGRRITGILDASGMDAEGFKCSPIDAVSPSERARVKFSDIRSVTFYRRTADILAQKPRPQPRQAGMKKVELMFKRGDTISGYVQREYSEGRQRFLELLPLDQDSDIDYTIIEYSAVVEKKTLA